MTVRTRPEEPGDNDFLRALVMDTIAEELGAQQWPEPLRSQVLGLQYANRRQCGAGTVSSVIEASSQPAGWLTTRQSPDSTWVVEIMVSANWRGRGVGTSVIRDILRAGKPVHLWVNMNNLGARRLYERLGFRYLENNGVQYLMRNP